MASHHYVPIETDGDWKSAVNDPGFVVTFSSPAEEQAYEQQDNRLNTQIKALVHHYLGDSADSFALVSDDWWPSRCRYVDLATSIVSSDLLAKLQTTLTGDFKTWRIQIIVYDDIAKGSTMVGGIFLYADRIAIERTVLERLKPLRDNTITSQ